MNDFEKAKQAVIEFYNASPETQEMYTLGDYGLFITLHPTNKGTVPYSVTLYADGSVLLLTHNDVNEASREDVKRLREIVRDYLTAVLSR